MNFVDLSIKSVVAGALGWTAVCLLKRSSAATRHTALLLTLAGLSLLPLISAVVPRWQVPFLKVAEKSPSVSASTFAPTVNLANVEAVQANSDNPISLLNVALAVWLVIAVVLCLRLVAKLIFLSQAERQLAMNADPRIQALVAERCHENGRHVLLLVGREDEPPMTWGFARPVLALPPDASEWPEDRLNSVVLHELAHIQRGDWLASVLAQLCCAIYWFNPTTWIIKRSMEVESEAAADDRVLSQGISGPQYAGHLLDISRNLKKGSPSTKVALAMARPGRLDQRVRAILEGRRSRRTVGGSVTLALAAIITCLVALLAAAVPTVIRKVEYQANRRPEPDITITSHPDFEPQVEVSGGEVKSSANYPGVLESSKESSSGHTSAETEMAGESAVKSQPTQSVVAENAKSSSTHFNADDLVRISKMVSEAAKKQDVKVDFDSTHFAEDMKHVGVDLSVAAIQAAAEIARSAKDSFGEAARSAFAGKAMEERLKGLSKSSHRIKTNISTKELKAQIESALKSLKTMSSDHEDPPEQQP